MCTVTNLAQMIMQIKELAQDNIRKIESRQPDLETIQDQASILHSSQFI